LVFYLHCQMKFIVYLFFTRDYFCKGGKVTSWLVGRSNLFFLSDKFIVMLHQVMKRQTNFIQLDNHLCINTLWFSNIGSSFILPMSQIT
jgi:hypothetical protein